ncbi:hypothetical protein V2J09_008958, partial [Rumex salicifolius]
PIVGLNEEANGAAKATHEDEATRQIVGPSTDEAGLLNPDEGGPLHSDDDRMGRGNNCKRLVSNRSKTEHIYMFCPLVNIRSVDEVVIIGATLSLSSSAFVLQLLADKGELPTRFGSATLGILLLKVFLFQRNVLLITIEGDEARQVSIDVLHLLVVLHETLV